MEDKKTIKCECIVDRQLFAKDDFRILSLRPTKTCRELKLNNWGSFSVKGSLGYLTIGEKYTFVLSEGEIYNGQQNYIIEDVPSLVVEDLSSLSDDEKFNILKNCTSSDKIAKNILKGCPNYIEMVVSGQADKVDLKAIKGVGKAYHNAYTQKLLSKYKYFTFCNKKEIKYLNLSVEEAKHLFNVYVTEENILKAIDENVYDVLINDLRKTFKKADKIILEKYPQYKTSEIRCSAVLTEILNKRMEETKSTVIPTKDVYMKLRQDYHLPEITDKLIVDTCLNNDNLVFNKESKVITTKRQYNKEKFIYNFIINKLSNPSEIEVQDINKYKKSKDGFELTEEQFDLIDKAVKNEVVLLTGYAGCVDKDTEFFNGKEWKPISEYNEYDMVLQYNTKHLKYELVKPYTYIKKSEREWILIKNKYGRVIQQLSLDHIVTVFDVKTGDIIDCNILKAILKFNKNKIEKHRYYFLGYNDAVDLKDVDYVKLTKKGYKYCFKVPSEHLLLRKNNYTFITHNCGKTSSLTNLLDLYDDVGLSYTLLAPTGSASVVLEESTHRKASTAHLKCLTSTITSDILILDEMSMFDIDTLYMVFSSIENQDIRIILSGDDKQLAPVGLGCVFADLLAWKDIPKVSLSKPFRYGKNGISTVATNTRHQIYTEETDNLQHYKRYLVDGNNIAHCKASMLSCYLSVLKHCKIKDLIGITGYNVGDLGVEELNKCIQAEINPPQPTKKEIVINNIVYRVGDRVVNTQNDYHALSYDAYNELKNDKTNQLTTGDVADETIANGMRGTIVNIYDDKAIVVLFDIDEKLIVYSPDKYNNLSLAYVINFHKSQGAGIKNVICLITPLHKRVLSRNLLYVGQTRAKESLIEILDEYTYKKALTIDALSSRKTNLQLFLNKKN